MRAIGAGWLCLVAIGCGSDSDGGSSGGGSSGSSGNTAPPTASCAAAGGNATVAVPTIVAKLAHDGEESWLASPGIADLDGDGKPEIVVARGGQVVAYRADGSRLFAFDTGEDRIWASPVIGDFAGDAKLEVAVAARDKAWIVDLTGNALNGFPVKWGTETRTLAAGDLDGDGKLDLVVGVRQAGDVVRAYKGDGSTLPGFPPVASDASGCTKDTCFFAGLYDQNLAIGDLDGDGKHELVLPMDNAYVSMFHGTGAAIDANAMFSKRPKTPGVRYLHTLEQAQQGYADDEDKETQAHFTNTPPAIADIDRDGKPEVVMVGSAQNAAQSDRLRGVGLWVVKGDASRLAGWERPFEVKEYVLGLGDGFGKGLDDPAIPGADNLVGLTNQVTVADIDARPGLEMIFAGYDGKIHAVGADKRELWATPYATNGRALTGGVVVADLSGDGAPEIVFATYSPDAGKGALFVLSSAGAVLHQVPLPKRGAMAVPTIGDVKGDGTLAIVVSLKDAEAQNESVLVFGVASAKTNCVLWPTGRANNLRNGWVR